MCSLALFSYPYARNSYVHFVLLCIIQLSRCEELLCVSLTLFSYPYARNSYVHLLSLTFDNQHMFYIQQVTMSGWHGIFVMTYSAPLISL